MSVDNVFQQPAVDVIFRMMPTRVFSIDFGWDYFGQCHPRKFQPTLNDDVFSQHKPMLFFGRC